MFEVFSGCSALQIGVLIISALLVGVNKTAVPGLGVIPVMMLASAFEPRLSAGIQLVMIAICDLMAVVWYRRGADWKIILRLLPWAVTGVAVGAVLLRIIPADNDVFMRRLIGAIVLALAVMNFVKSKMSPDKIPTGIGASAFFGILLGTTTQLANAAGPVSSIYFLSMKLDKARYMVTAAWFFLIVNYIKVPIFIWEGRITAESAVMNLWLIPVMAVGAVIGVLLFRKIPQKIFDGIIQVFVVVAAVKMLFF